MYHNLKKLRESLRMTQVEFGESLGIARTTYNNYENGIRKPDSDFWIMVAEKYHVTVDYLMGLSDVPILTSEQPNALQLSLQERAFLQKYRALDERGKATVTNLLNWEYDRLIAQQEVNGATK